MAKRGKLLIVDDVELNRAILKEAFQNDFDILEAKNGIECLELIKQNKNELKAIFLDIIMPEIDGFGVLQELENSNILKVLPVFLITTETTDYVVNRAYQYGVVDVIPKPFDLLIITRRVFNIIELFENRRTLARLLKAQKAKMAAEKASEEKQ